MGEEEGIGLATALGMLVFRFVGDQRQVAFGAGPVGEVGVAHQALRYPFRIEVGQRGQGSGDQQLRDPDPEGAGDQLDADHQAEPVQLRPERGQARCLLFGWQAAQGQQPVLQPDGQTFLGAVANLGHQQGNGFGEVADGLVALLEQPFGQLRNCYGCRAQHLGRHQLAWPAAGQEVHRPGRIGGVGCAEIVAHGGQLGVVRGGGIETAVEGGEGFHRIL